MFGFKFSRYKIIILAFFAAAIYIMWTAGKTMFKEKAYWTVVKERLQTDSVPEEAVRGNIYDCTGRIMVATLPEYIIRLDYVAYDKDSVKRQELQDWRDSIFTNCLDSIANGLAEIFPDKDAKWFKDRLLEGKKRKSRSWRIYPRNATFLQFEACKGLPLLRENKNMGGFTGEEVMKRKKFYGSLASRTLGEPPIDSLKRGLESCYDSILRGINGWSYIKKVRKGHPRFTSEPAVDGHDLVSTIDVRYQDIAEKALVNQMKEQRSIKGVAILMEVETGDIKALVSMTHIKDSVNGVDGYWETQNDAVNALWEPGSTFKTGSIMVAMEDGHITPDTRVETGEGVWRMYDRDMKDHKATGFGNIDVREIVAQSSNIGVSRIIDKYYHNNPEKFVQGLNNIGVGIPLGMPMGTDPRVRRPEYKNGHWTNWTATTLPWMSIGYETQIPPISTLAFYNAIANNGKMVRPRFVRAELSNGNVVREFPTEVIKEKICSDKTLHNMQDILQYVVDKGVGRAAGNKQFKVSGKTGTARCAVNGKYTGRHLVSFCGYFPSEKPKYSCIVCLLQGVGSPSSGGSQCGPVFREISQLVMSSCEYRSPDNAADSTSVFTPLVAAGNMKETRSLLSLMHMPWQEDDKSCVWGSVGVDSVSQKLRLEPRTTGTEIVPDVRGMGARDAVYALQSVGLKVKLNGVGKVREQNIPAGTRNARGKTITINLR